MHGKTSIRDDFKKKYGIFNELGIKGGRGVILKHDFFFFEVVPNV